MLRMVNWILRKTLYELDVMPFFAFNKSGLNLNGKETFTSWQFGYIEIIKFKSMSAKREWLT